MNIIMIAAIAANRVIGRDNSIPWHLPSDLKHFKKTTAGSPMLMGRKTFESFGSRPLPGRPHIVVSRTGKVVVDQAYADRVFVVTSIEEGLACAATMASKLYVIGGGTIYEQMMERADSIILTELEAEYEGDATFPVLEDHWKLVSEEHPFECELPYVIRHYRRG